MTRSPSGDEQAFLLTLARLVVGRRGWAMSFELDDGVRVCALPPYGFPAHVRFTVDSAHSAHSDGGSPVTPHDVACHLSRRARAGLG